MPLDLTIDFGTTAPKRICPNEFPTIQTSYRLCICGEAPGAEEDEYGRPFLGPSGYLLENLMSNASILRSAVLMCNLAQVRPPKNEYKLLSNEDKLAGLTQLTSDLRKFQPHCIVLLGNEPSAIAGVVGPISSWRGSILKCDLLSSPFFGFKVIPALHPAGILRDFTGMPLLLFDLKRARRESEFPELRPTLRTISLDHDATTICHILDSWPAGQLLSFDLEGGLDAFPCCSVADSANNVFIIAWSKFSFDEECRVLRSLANVLYRADVPKCLQNSLYDNFVLCYGYKMLIRNVFQDTMLKGWEVYPELPKSLGCQASIWTKEPFYKFERKTDDQRVYWTYCCKDSAVTYEIAQAQDHVLQGSSLSHYRFNMSLLPALLYMEMRGIRYDLEKAVERRSELSVELAQTKTRLTLQSGGADLFGPKGSISPQKLATLLYTKLGLPKQFKKEAGRLTTALTTDVEALLTLHKKTEHPTLHEVLTFRSQEKTIQALEAIVDPDGRVRCGYNLVGTETGRLTCYESPTGSGGNLQTVTKKLRDLYLADDGMYFFQCDLAGADGWTVATHCARLGGGTMLDDYFAGIKPAWVVALMYLKGPEVAKWPRDRILEVAFSMRDKKKGGTGELSDENWLYFACKRVQHATNYLVGKNTGSAQILKDSYKLTGNPIYVSPSDFLKLQNLYRYGRYAEVSLWHQWATAEWQRHGKLSCASGHVRTFFGRKKEAGKVSHETLKEVLAHEPQANTTYATNLAMWNLWHDKQNILPNNQLIIQPLHQVHDALCGQFPQDRLEWAKAKIRHYFDNKITIGGREIVIPFDGGYGTSWGELKNKL